MTTNPFKFDALLTKSNPEHSNKNENEGHTRILEKHKQ